jgi:hypothetical protein
MAIVAAILPCYQGGATTISITNPSFEDPALSYGGIQSGLNSWVTEFPWNDGLARTFYSSVPENGAAVGRVVALPEQEEVQFTAGEGVCRFDVPPFAGLRMFAVCYK